MHLVVGDGWDHIMKGMSMAQIFKYILSTTPGTMSATICARGFASWCNESKHAILADFGRHSAHSEYPCNNGSITSAEYVSLVG